MFYVSNMSLYPSYAQISECQSLQVDCGQLHEHGEKVGHENGEAEHRQHPVHRCQQSVNIHNVASNMLEDATAFLAVAVA